PPPPDAPSHPVPTFVPPSSTSGPLLVSDVSFDKQESGQTFVVVETSRIASYHVSTLPSPARLVVDIDGAENNAPQKTYTADTPVLKDVRVGQFHWKDPSIVRVVADLNGDPAYEVHATPVGLRIELRPRGMAKSASLAPPDSVPDAKPVEARPAMMVGA